MSTVSVGVFFGVACTSGIGHRYLGDPRVWAAGETGRIGCSMSRREEALGARETRGKGSSMRGRDAETNELAFGWCAGAVVVLVFEPTAHAILTQRPGRGGTNAHTHACRFMCCETHSCARDPHPPPQTSPDGIQTTRDWVGDRK